MMNSVKKIPVLYNEKKECCGCAACYAICPNDAIRMKSDEEGFDYPSIEKDKCTRCYECIRVCPFKDGLS